ncbi:DUF5752 family protein [Desulfurivibrio alkaliphilus]|uniref:Uncharacterized protein n=1 Tax=Desulfurivibrio alkaliphilus (strain DSM 19089 / UNIQEM U267 / AHT2) TaxID=589865 RepID=D6Z022_DESAT|nr:DUF5752 family protein [Desulfurivibrio alkaliphilus]ADH85179.1 conserved hypothetical protein [Desulfurivibrio alkaliphilus AHT 2]
MVASVTPQVSASRQPFALKDCSLIAIATGRKAFTLAELRDHLKDVTLDSVYHHFWGGLLGARFEEREFNNDFAAWCRHHLYELELAEQLAVVDPGEHRELEGLRREVLDIIDERLDSSELAHWRRAPRPFEFIRSQLVIFATGKTLQQPTDLAAVLPEISTGSVFYHFIDSRRRLEDGGDDFSFWLAGFGDEYQELRNSLDNIDPFFASLSQVRDDLARLCREHCGINAHDRSKG